MTLMKTTVHYLTLPTGERIKYLRLGYWAGRAWIGQSVLASRFSPAFVVVAEAGAVRKKSC